MNWKFLVHCDAGMDLSSFPGKSFLPPSYRPPSSVKRAAPEDESCEPSGQQMSSEMCIMEATLSPPGNVPLPPALPPPGFINMGRRAIVPAGICVPRFSSGLHIPKETVEMWDMLFFESCDGDVKIHTEDGGSFLAHSIVLIASSPVFRSLIETQRIKKRFPYNISVAGVSCTAARVFVRFLYSSRYEPAEMKKYVLHLVVLSHVYNILHLKKFCAQYLEREMLKIDNVIDVLQLARLCDVPRLNLVCLRLIIKDFKSVAKTEGWRVMRESDPSLEQELVEAVIEADSRRQEKLRKIEEERVYGQLRDAMEALVHICRDGCRTIGPHDKTLDGKQQGPCNYPACKGLESLVRHFAACKVKVSGGCVHCKRMWQLLELHSRMCEEADSCKVPLCRHFREKVGQQSKKEENKWKLLVSKVIGAKGSGNCFSLATVSARLEQE